MIKVTHPCGGCTACCYTHYVISINKSSRSECPYCNVGKGCSVYGDHPQECQNFACSWALGIAGNIDHRPDKTGIVPTHRHITGAGLLLLLWEYKSGALKTQFCLDWTRRNLLKGNFTVHFPIAGPIHFYLSPGEGITAEVWSSLETYWQREVECIPFEEAFKGLVL